MTQPNNNSIEIELTAPGKIILFGEHSVVYGKKAIAATLGLYTKLNLTENSSGHITLQFPCIGYEETFPLENIRKHFKQNGSGTGKEHTRATAEIFDKFYAEHGGKALNEGRRYSLITFFDSLSYFAESCPGFVLRVETDLPVSSGAGSSASFSVIITTALILLQLAKSNKLSEFVIRNEGDGAITIRDGLREMISERAFACECLFHGTPSGIDHNVILHGHALEFVKGESGNKLKSIIGGTIKILLVNTKVPRSTLKQVENVRKLKEKYPGAIQSVFDAMGNIAEEAVEILTGLKKDGNGIIENETRLSGLVDLNHGLLRTVGVSHDSLEKVSSIARKYNLSSKLTGAGGGGLSFVYLPSQTSPGTVSDLKRELVQAGFDASEAVLGGPGLTVKKLST